MENCGYGPEQTGKMWGIFRVPKARPVLKALKVHRAMKVPKDRWV
jgi:hypothetical protein